MASFDSIDYSLRPAKHAERKMLCEMFSRLRNIAPLEQYQYIGFGSLWFSDCALIHRSLGINNITSIEHPDSDEERFIFNRPYRNINLRMGYAADILPSINWTAPTILWLDYDGELSPDILEDVRTCASRIQHGSVLAISVNSHSLKNKNEDLREPIIINDKTKYRDYFGTERTPDNLDAIELIGWKLSKTIRIALLDEIRNELLTVNAMRSAKKAMHFKQIAAFEYKDRARMTTIVGIFIDDDLVDEFESCRFNELNYFRNSSKAFRIEVPILTNREMRYLDRRLPLDATGAYSNITPIPDRQANNYALLYRYLPNFASFEP